MNLYLITDKTKGTLIAIFLNEDEAKCYVDDAINGWNYQITKIKGELE